MLPPPVSRFVGSGHAHDANAATSSFCFHQPSGFADVNLAAARGCNEFSARMFECYIAAAGVEASEIFNRSHADVSANCVQRRVTCDRTGGDMATASVGDQIARDILHCDVAAVGMSDEQGRQHFPRGCCRRPLKFAIRPLMSSVSMFPPPVETSNVVVLRHIHFDSYPKRPRHWRPNVWPRR